VGRQWEGRYQVRSAVGDLRTPASGSATDTAVQGDAPTSTREVETPEGAAVRRALVQSPVFAQAMWSCLDRDAITAFHIVSVSGQMLYANDAAGRVFSGKQIQSAKFFGTFLHEIFDPEMVKARLAIMERVHEAGTPVYVRGVFHGQQTVTRYEPCGMIEGVTGAAGDHRVMLLTTRVDPRSLEQLTPPGVQLISPRQQSMGPLHTLSPVELELLAHIAEGMTIQEIALHLSKSVHTVNEQRRKLGKKLGVEDRMQLAELARIAGLTERDKDVRSSPHYVQSWQPARTPPWTGEQIRARLLAAPAFVQGLWRSLNDDPYGAFQVVAPDGLIVHANPEATQMFLGPGVPAARVLGMAWGSLRESDLIRERIDSLKWCAHTSRGRMTRSIHLGRQIVTRLEPCEPIHGIEALPLGSSASRVPPHTKLILNLSRHTAASVLLGLPKKIRTGIHRYSTQNLGTLGVLTDGELEVLAGIGEGLSNRQIAMKLHRSEDAVEDRRQKIGEKLKIEDRVQLAELAQEAGLMLEDISPS
jgi:DNA-binding NarL/FixJ family response regulator